VIFVLDLAFKDLWGHKVRTILTALGIIVAITAIISLGSISAGINHLITSSGSSLGSDTIIVMKRVDFSQMFSGGSSGSYSIPDMEPEEIDAVSGVSGVKRAVPVVSRMMGAGMFFEVDGIDMNQLDIFGAQDIAFKEGGWPENGEMAIAVGSLISETMGLSVGDNLVLNGKEVEVTGIFEEGSGNYDYAAIMPYDTAQDVYEMEGKATEVLLEPDDISAVNNIVDNIEEENDDLMAITITDALNRAKEATATLDIMTLGIGFVASIVAAIGIIITMYTSVIERKKEIGIMKAIGSQRRVIIIQILQEAFILSVISGLIGLFLSFFMVGILNNVLMGGANLALITPELAIGAIVYGIALTLIFSFYPAWVASRTDPIKAIRGQ
jgi:putative ABC transport system permease protein